MKLAKKIPVFNKRHENLPEIILTLYECNVPITRSVWYIKMLAAQATNPNEVQKKKRQTNLDPSNEWTLPLVKFLRELFNRMKETINQPNSQAQQAQQQQQQQQQTAVATIESFMTNDNNNSFLLSNNNYLTEEKIKNLWDYATKLMRAMLDQNLLDKQSILDFIIDLLEKSRLFDRNLKFILTIGILEEEVLLVFFLLNFFFCKFLVVQNINHFLQSELLSRRLAYYCCRKLSSLFNDQIILNDNKQEPLQSVSLKPVPTTPTGLKVTTSTCSPTQQQQPQQINDTSLIKKDEVQTTPIKLKKSINLKVYYRNK